MVTRAIKPKRDDMAPAAWQSIPERAPSVVIQSKPTLTRVMAAVGLLLTAIGILALLAPIWKFPYMVGYGWGIISLSIGLALLLMHAITDREEQFRRVYGFVNLLALYLILIGTMLRYLPIGPKSPSWFLAVIIPALTMILLFLGAVLRHETTGVWRQLLTRSLLVASALMIVTGIVNVSVFRGNFVDEGSLFLILGLGYGAVAINYLAPSPAHVASLCLGAVGLFCVAEGQISWFMPDFFVPSGFILIVMGLVYFAVSLGILSDLPFIVLTRRELAAFFYSPVAYPVFVGFMAINMWAFAEFLFNVILRYGPRGDLFDPIVVYYAYALYPVIAQMFVVPVLTMRLLSEEKSSGTLEVLLTAPVNEPTVVLSKFFAALVFYLIMWLPWWLFLVSLRVVGGEEFDYRPLLCFAPALICTGASFIAMGVFFSSVTRNQIIAAVLTFVGMMGHLSTMLMPGLLELQPGTTGYDIFRYISFLSLWRSSLTGQLAPRFLLFYASVTIFFLFLAIKVLESRKWK